MAVESTAKQKEKAAISAPPMRGTSALNAYVRAYLADVRFFSFICNTVMSADYAAHVAQQALDGAELKEKRPVDLAKSAPGVRTKILRENSQALLEMFIARLADNFQKYLVDLIREILRSKPTMLSTKLQTMTLEDVLKHDTIESLTHDVIERRVNALSYDGFAELQKWCVERGILIEVATSKRDLIIELISTRNIIAHNRGFVDERYLRSVKHTKFNAGDCRKLRVDDFFDGLKLLNEVVFGTDSKARRKFDLAKVEVRPRKKSTAKQSAKKIAPPSAEMHA